MGTGKQMTMLEERWNGSFGERGPGRWIEVIGEDLRNSLVENWKDAVCRVVSREF